MATTTTIKRRARDLRPGMTLPTGERIVSVQAVNHFPGWPAAPSTTIAVRFAGGPEGPERIVGASYGPSQYVTVNR